MRATIFLVRHAETPANVGAKRVRGNLDVPLDANGAAQAQAVGAEFQGLPVKVVFSSNLQRTLSVAQQIAQNTGAQVVPTPALRSWDRGRYTGELEDQVRPYIDWYVRNPQEVIPGGESLSQFVERFGTFLLQQLQMLENNPDAGPFVDVTHAWDLNALLAVLSGGREDVIEGSAPPPGAILRLDWDGKEWQLAHHTSAPAKAKPSTAPRQTNKPNAFQPMMAQGQSPLSEEPGYKATGPGALPHAGRTLPINEKKRPTKPRGRPDTTMPGPSTLRKPPGLAAAEQQRGFTKKKRQPKSENLFMGKKGNSFL